MKSRPILDPLCGNQFCSCRSAYLWTNLDLINVHKYILQTMSVNKSVLDLVAAAEEAKMKAKADFSHFRVGAAIEGESGKIYSAFNIESSSYGLSMCAERIALWTAVVSGERKFRRLAIVSDAADFCQPCGACRQVIQELAGNIEIYMTDKNGNIKRKKLSTLLPHPFTSKTLLDGRD
jgi:cytidine deaminase